MTNSNLLDIENLESLKSQISIWSQQFDVNIIFDNNSYKNKFSNYEFLVACGIHSKFEPDFQPFESLNHFINESKDWVFGYFAYDLKNKIENLSSNNPDELNFPDIFFFIPKYIFLVKDSKLQIITNDTIGSNEIYQEISKIQLNSNIEITKKLSIQNQITKEEYIKTVNQIKSHIKRGDIYEMNYCQNFYNNNASIDPFSVYKQLNSISPTPYSCYMRNKNHYLICASPERYIAKNKNQIISQPIKGTIKRAANQKEDNELINILKNNPKDRAENIMIVDLVRNDLSKTAIKASVEVLELCQIYSFNQVHQMISTIKSEHNTQYSIVDIIKHTFPMGSMTGAPKIRAMELIEQYENFKRGLFSGAVGYFDPNGNFDFNVVIRSILYNSENKYLSYKTGGAITYKSIPENEYDECMIKAKAINQILKH